MQVAYRDSSELIIGMALAEISLFILFLIWWTNAAQAGDTSGVPPRRPSQAIISLR